MVLRRRCARAPRGALPNERGDFSERLHRANLVVDGHHRDELHRSVERVGETIEVDPTVPVDTDDSPTAVLDRVKNGVVFDGGAHGDCVGTGLPHDPEDGHVVRLGASPHKTTSPTWRRDARDSSRLRQSPPASRSARATRGVRVPLREAEARRDGSSRSRLSLIEVPTRPGYSLLHAVEMSLITRRAGASGTYGDVYDEWFGEVSDVAATVKRIVGWLDDGPPGPVLELGVGTGRVALALAVAGVEVFGVDASAAMLARLRDKPGGADLPVTLADMAGLEPPGPFALVLGAYNTLFNLTTAGASTVHFQRGGSTDSGRRLVIEASCLSPRARLGGSHHPLRRPDERRSLGEPAPPGHPDRRRRIRRGYGHRCDPSPVADSLRDDRPARHDGDPGRSHTRGPLGRLE